MGTNYHVKVPPCASACEHCAQAGEIQIGKSSGGWRFLHRAYRSDFLPAPLTEPVIDRASWLRLLDIGPIVDEYGREHTRDDLIDLIETKQDGIVHGSPKARELGFRGDQDDFQADGYDFCAAEFS